MLPASGLSRMRGDLQWHRTELAARQANGRGDVSLAVKLFAQSVEEARNPEFHWSELKSALSGSALFHEHVTHNYSLALAQLREAQAILNQHIGADAHEARNFAECVAGCEAKAEAAGDRMGSTEFQCSCGFAFLNSTDNRSYVAHFIADQDLDAFWALIDAAIEQSGPNVADKEQACMNLRSSLLNARQRVWQCGNCCRIYVTDASGKTHGFEPDSDASRDLLGGRPQL